MAVTDTNVACPEQKVLGLQCLYSILYGSAVYVYGMGLRIIQYALG